MVRKIDKYFWTPGAKASGEQIKRFKQMRERFWLNHKMAEDYLPDALFDLYDGNIYGLKNLSYLRRCWRDNATRALRGAFDDIRDGRVGYYKKKQIEIPRDSDSTDALFENLRIEVETHKHRKRV